MQLVSLGYRTDLMLLRLQGSVVDEREDHWVVRTPANPTFHWGNYVLADESWVERPLADLVEIFHTEHPAAGHLAIGLDGVDGVVWGEEDLVECRLELERSVVMTAREVRAPLRPNAVAVCRMLASDADWAAAVVLHATEHGEYEPGAHREFVQRRMDARREMQDAGLGGWFGAFASDEMVCGLGLFTDGSGLGRFQDVATLASARRQGLAATLIHHASTVGLQNFGIRDLVMVADPDYTAIRVYRSLGFTDSETQIQLGRTSA